MQAEETGHPTGYEAYPPTVEANLHAMVQSMKGLWLGPMPYDSFTESFLPEPSLPCPDVPKDLFDGVPTGANEQDLFNAFIGTIHEQNLVPGFKLVNTSNHSDKGSNQRYASQPDLSLYKSQDTVTDQEPTKLDRLQMNFLFKKDENHDPFQDPVFPKPGAAPMTDEQKADWVFTRPKSHERNRCLGQLPLHAAEWFSRQFRCFGFTVLVTDPWVRFIRWDRAGAIVSRKFNFRRKPHHLVNFLWRFSHADDAARGVDTTVRDATTAETEFAWSRLPIEAQLRDKERLVTVFAFPNDGGGVREFAGWYPTSEPWSLTGRCTRAYPVIDLEDFERKENDGEKVPVYFLKDVWRAADLEKESSILQDLTANDVPHIAPFVCGDDVLGHTTTTDRYVPGNNEEEDEDDPVDPSWVLGNGFRRITPRVHNRHVVGVYGRPIEMFDCSKQMLQAVADAFEAHYEAYAKCNILHRDISCGNILIGPDGRGILIDWDLCRRLKPMPDAPRRHERTGTWSFMSALLLKSLTKAHTIQDDMESFVYVVLYLGLRYLPHNRSLQTQDLVETIFDNAHLDGNGRRIGGFAKLNMFSYQIHIEENFGFPGNAPLTTWVLQAIEFAREWVLSCLNAKNSPENHPLRKFSTHEALKSLFSDVLGRNDWPTGDGPKDALSNSVPQSELIPEIALAKKKANYGSKRPHSSAFESDGEDKKEKRANQGSKEEEVQSLSHALGIYRYL